MHTVLEAAKNGEGVLVLVVVVQRILRQTIGRHLQRTVTVEENGYGRSSNKLERQMASEVTEGREGFLKLYLLWGALIRTAFINSNCCHHLHLHLKIEGLQERIYKAGR